MTIIAMTEQPLCERFGHFWRETKQHGKLFCRNCKAIAYCPRCLFVVPKDAPMAYCKKHEERTMETRNQTRSQRPAPPEMLPNGQPSLTTLRRSRYHSMTEDRHTEPAISRSPAQRRRLRLRRLIALAAIVALVVVGIVAFWQQTVVPAFQGLQDQWHYGDSHISQFDANVGHGGVSHFLAEYYQGAIIVIEIPEGNFNNTHVYTLTGMVDGSGSTVILLSTEPGKIPGKPDLVIQVEESNFHMVLYNTGSAFQRSA
jgi:hypothetical protein